MLGWELPPHNSGGLGVACNGLASALTLDDVIVSFVLPYSGIYNQKDWQILFADTYFQELGTDTSFTFAAYKQVGSACDISDFLYRERNGLINEVQKYALRMQCIAEHEDFDIIHAHDWLSFLAGITAKRISKKPLIVHVHATEFDRTGGQGLNQDVFDIEKLGMEVADAVITVSDRTKRTVMKEYGIPESKIHVVYNGIDTSELEKQKIDISFLKQIKREGGHIVLFLGRLTIQKGPDYFVEAARTVLEKMPHTYFIMVGSGDMKEHIMEDIAYSGLSKNFVFVEAMGPLAYSFFSHADVYVMPSLSEPFGLTVLESMRNSTPVIVSRQSGVSEIIKHVLLVDFWNTDEIAEKILAVLSYPALQKTLSQNGLPEASRINWKHAAQTCKHLYQSFIAWLFPKE